MLRPTLSLLLLIFLMGSCSNSELKSEEIAIPGKDNPTLKVVLSSEIRWEMLNAARGKASPLAGTVWGDRKGSGPTGFFAKFVDGFSSPPHIHNVTYRAVVIKGLVHNDDENAENMWMSPGSFWTQPVGQAHITSAKGEENIAYVEIDEGPYLVKPTEEAFESPERPVNIDSENVVWLDESKCNWIAANCNAEVSFLWETEKMQGLFIKLPKGFQGHIQSDGDVFHAIVVQGIARCDKSENESAFLDPTSYFGSEGLFTHRISSEGDDAAILYVRTNGTIKIN